MIQFIYSRYTHQIPILNAYILTLINHSISKRKIGMVKTPNDYADFVLDDCLGDTDCTYSEPKFCT